MTNQLPRRSNPLEPREPGWAPVSARDWPAGESPARVELWAGISLPVLAILGWSVLLAEVAILRVPAPPWLVAVYACIGLACSVCWLLIVRLANQWANAWMYCVSSKARLSIGLKHLPKRIRHDPLRLPTP